MTIVAWILFVIGALLEVGATLSFGRVARRRYCFDSDRFTVLGSYGLIVNTIEWDFSKLFGVYVCVFALVSVLCGKFVSRENIPGTTWFGLGVILAGGLIIQFGPHR